MSEHDNASIRHDSDPVALDGDGHLEHFDDWSPAVANWLAEREGRELSDDHWEILYLLRDFYTRFDMAPAMRALVKATRQQLGEKKGSSIYLMRLFPDSPARVAARLAGLPRPTNCL
ncbi:TusE/DsrC/DsvC family sulfur relay protein [Kushneria aurantia]|uniref:Sulfurtransferase n=1 Tax=Kushneria aurantia TaxID=504092 RepID=A0ABV6G416_9GAMM|nr:TusE/DsrC/DsvC family sulfur relay protein [Kushneria aurantia]